MSLPRRFSYYAIRFLLLVLIVAGFTIQSASLSHAQSDAYSTVSTTPLGTDDHTRAQSLLIDISSAIICQLVGIDPVNPQKGCVVLDPINHKLSYAPQQNGIPQIGGILGTTSSMIGSLYTKPASTGESVRYLANNFGIGEHIYAQDNPDNQGFKGLSSLQSTWLITRNIAYLLLTLLFIVIGFAIMLRVHIDPRTIMSIQNQIPKIIIAVIMITFSYAIVGFLIDTMWFFSYVVINTLTTDEVDKSVLKNDIIFDEGTGIYDTQKDALLSEYHPQSSTNENGDSTGDNSGLSLDNVHSSSVRTLSEIAQYEDQCTGDCATNLTKAKSTLCSHIDPAIAAQVECSADDELDIMFRKLSDATFLELQGNKNVPREELANHLYSSYITYSSASLGRNLADFVKNYTNNLSLRQEATLHLNSTPLTYVNGILSWGGGITDGNGIFGLSFSVSRTLGDVISKTLSAALGLDTNDCKATRPWTWADCGKSILQSTVKYIATFLTILIVLAAIFVALLKVWFNLLRALVYVVIYTVIGPLMIVVGLFPGSPYSFSRWIRALLAHLMVFPATIFVFVLARIMASNTASNNPEGTSFLPPLIVNTNTFDNFGLLVAFGLILITPEVLNWVRAAFSAKPGPVGGVISAGFLAGKQLASGPTKWGLGLAFRPYDPAKGSMGFLRRAVTGGTVAPGEKGTGFRKRIIRPIVGAFSPNEIKPTGGH